MKLNASCRKLCNALVECQSRAVVMEEERGERARDSLVLVERAFDDIECVPDLVPQVSRLTRERVRVDRVL